MKFEKPKGTRDILPPESAVFGFLEQAANEVAGEFNAKMIKTPTFEATNLFVRTVGEGSDIVSKEMYTFTDKGGRNITLRPEMTAGVVRAVIENGTLNQTLPAKFCYIGNMFRYEKPQAGRFREFWQFGLECFGAAGAIADFEAISMADEFLRRAGVEQNYTLYINSIGCPDCRAKYNLALQKFMSKNITKMCDDCKTRFQKNPLRILDCKNEACKKINAKAPKIVNELCQSCNTDFEALKLMLTQAGIVFKVDSGLVRGLDYYTKTVFEFIVEKFNEDRPLTIAAGGRYDKLVEELGGPPTPAVGFGIGLDRVASIINIQPPALDVYVANAGNVKPADVLYVVQTIRKMGLSCEFNLAERSLKTQFKLADKLGAETMLLLGDKEAAEGRVTIKDMATGKERSVRLDDLNKIAF
ncbi:MAG: histidine--tRNA ligase [Firmicutes bacterium]|nr:histidine--tRNA ligase [Bacillota bacterium]